MNCVHCGTENHDGRRYCKSCARDVQSPDDVAVDTSEWLNLDDVQPETSKLALASLAFGLLSIFPPAGLSAVLLGHASLLSIHQSDGRLRGGDVAKLGLICGYVGLALFASVMFAATRYLNVPLRALVISQRVEAATLPATNFSIPTPVDVTPTANELEGMNALLQLSVAETVHFHSHPDVGYACSINMLHDSGLTRDAVSSAAESGFLLQIQSCAKSPTGKVMTYTALATPRAGINVRPFCTDHTGIIRTPVNSDLRNCSSTGTPIK